MLMNKKYLFLPLLLAVMTVDGEQVVRIVGNENLDRSFATEKVRKLVLTSDSVDVVNNNDSVLLRVHMANIARVEFTEGTPEAVEATIVRDNDAVKIIDHGQVYILRSGRKYTIMGIEVEEK